MYAGAGHLGGGRVLAVVVLAGGGSCLRIRLALAGVRLVLRFLCRRGDPGVVIVVLHLGQARGLEPQVVDLAVAEDLDLLVCESAFRSVRIVPQAVILDVLVVAGCRAFARIGGGLEDSSVKVE